MEKTDARAALEKRLRWNIKGVFIVRLLAISSAGLLTPILALYVTGGNVSDSRFFLLQAAFHLTALALDAPFGYLADRFGRKIFVTAGAALLAIGAVCYASSSTLPGFLAAEIAFAIGQAAIFGAEQALLRDSLERLDRHAEFQRLWGYALSLEMAAAAVTTVASSYLYAWNHRAPFLLEAFLYLILVLVSLTLYEAPRQLIERKAGAARVLKLCFVQNAWIRWMMLALAVWTAVLIATLWCQSKMLLMHGVPEAHLGFWFASLNLFAGVVGFAAAHLKRDSHKERISLALICLLALAMFLAARPAGPFALFISGAGLFACQTVRAISRIVFASWLKDELPTEYHATGSSLNTALSRLGFVFLAVCLGPFIDGWTIPEKFQVLLGIAIGSGILLAAFFPRRMLAARS